MKKVKKVIQILKCNFWTLVKFESIFKICTILIFTPLFLKLFKFIMQVTGYSYLTIENICSFLFTPFPFFMILILIFLMTIYTMFDITTVILILDLSRQNKKVSVLDAIFLSLQKCKKMFKIQNLALPFFVLFLIPFLHIGVASSFISTIQIPEYILSFIINNQVLFPLLLVFIIFLGVLLLKSIYALHYFVLEDVSFKEARKRSKILSRKKHVQDLFSFLAIQFILAIFYFLFVAIGIFVIFCVNRFLGSLFLLKSVLVTSIWGFIAFSFLIISVLATPFGYATISVLFSFRKEQKKEEMVSVFLKKDYQNQKENLWLKKGIIILFIFAFLGGIRFSYGIYKGEYNLNIEHTRTLEVTAHRGDSLHYPENTLQAFISAKELEADWVELDVQQIKDGSLIVMHDSNLKRTTGLNKNVWEVSREEVTKLQVGQIFSTVFLEEPIPFLEDVLRFSKIHNIKLNIELKPTGHETDFVSSVLDLIHKYNFINECVITSQTYEVLEEVKKQEPFIKTVYVMSLFFGDIDSLTAADHFSIEATNITKSLVKKIHNEGKEIYAWTVNSEEGIRKMIDLKVDNIVTDDVILAKNLIYSSKTSNLIQEYIRFIQNLM